MLAEGKAYHCYSSQEELDAMREAQRARGEKPRYDGRWRPEPAKELPEPPAGVRAGAALQEPGRRAMVTWDDLVKGPIIGQQRRARRPRASLRADGVPTYNFGVVVDDSTWTSPT